MGFRTLDEMIGRSDLLDKNEAIDHWKAKGLDFTRIFHKPEVGPEVAIRHVERQEHPIADVLDRELIAKAAAALENGDAGRRSRRTIRNADRTVGAMLSGEVAKRYGHEGLPDDTITVKLKGTAGQSFGAWLAAGVTLDPRGRGQRLRRQGALGRQADHPAVGRSARPRRSARSSSATRCSTAPSRANAISAASPASASRCAIPAPSRSSRAPATTAAST